jgi:hypothetical protein
MWRLCFPRSAILDGRHRCSLAPQRSTHVLKRDSQLLGSPDTAAEVDVRFAPYSVEKLDLEVVLRV